MESRNIVYDFGPILESFVGGDLLNPIKIRCTITLDHEVDGALLKQAWDRTKRVYPIVETVLGSDQGKHVERYFDAAFRESHADEHFYLVEPDGGTNDPVASKAPIMPGSDVVGGRLVSITYWGNAVSLSAFHALVDGQGSNRIIQTLLYFYLNLYVGHEDDHPVVEVREGRSLEEYYVGKTPALVDSLDFTPVPLYLLPCSCKGFWDEDMRNDEDCVYSGGMTIDASDFMRLCKANGSNPSSMLSVLCARAAYALNPSETRDLVFEFTVSERQALGLEDSIANVVGFAYAGISRDDVDSKTLAEATKQVRQALNMQRGKDYIATFARLSNMYKMGHAVVSRIITYVGPMSVGDNDEHVLGVRFETNCNANLYMAQFNDKFYITLMYGRATDKYLRELERMLTELGVSCEINRSAEGVAIDSLAIVS